jgi:hypothetical protein
MEGMMRDALGTIIGVVVARIIWCLIFDED